MARLLLVVSICALALCGTASAEPWTKSDQKLTASDGVQLATTLYEPSTAPTVGGFPAIVMFHGLGGTRASMNTIAEQVFAPAGYAVLTFDFRGHGESGGLFDLDGPREVQDVRELLDSLTARPEIDRAHVGAWGISLGGGAVWQSLKEGLPFAAAEVFETWVDLYEALAPGNLTKSGAIFQFLNSVPAERTAPELNAIKADALGSTNLGTLKTLASTRSVVDALGRIRTPVAIFQGRRDFAFGLEQGITAFQRLGGAKELYIGDFGHPPSTFPGPDANAMFLRSLGWFGRYLRPTAPPPTAAPPVTLAADPWQGLAVGWTRLPALSTVTTPAVRVSRTLTTRVASKVVASLPLPKRLLETFGAPVVTVTASTATRAPRLVAVLEAVTGGTSTIVSEGGTALPGRKSFTTSFRLVHDTALIRPGSKLRLTLAWTSTAQSPQNLLYLVGAPSGSALTVKRVRVSLPVLRQPVSR